MVMTRKAAVKRGKERKMYLKQWPTMGKPLALSSRPNDSRETFSCLLQALILDARKFSSDLPNLYDPITQVDFVNLLLKMSSLTSPSAPSAPVVGIGSFLSCLKGVHCNFLDLSL